MIEAGQLDIDIGRPVGAHSDLSGFDAGKAEGGRAVGDDKVPLGKVYFLAAEEGELPLKVLPDDVTSAFDGGGIVKVDRLTGEKHDVVSEVDDRIEGADARGFQGTADRERGLLLADDMAKAQDVKARARGSQGFHGDGRGRDIDRLGEMNQLSS